MSQIELSKAALEEGKKQLIKMFFALIGEINPTKVYHATSDLIIYLMNSKNKNLSKEILREIYSMINDKTLLSINISQLSEKCNELTKMYVPLSVKHFSSTKETIDNFKQMCSLPDIKKLLGNKSITDEEIVSSAVIPEENDVYDAFAMALSEAKATFDTSDLTQEEVDAILADGLGHALNEAGVYTPKLVNSQTKIKEEFIDSEANKTYSSRSLCFSNFDEMNETMSTKN